VTTTDENGNYYFGGLPAGTYTVVVTPPAGMGQTYDADDGTGPFNTQNQSTVTIGLGGINLDQDFGYVAPATPLGVIGDKVWYDADGDGVGPYGHGAAPGTDNGENGIAGVLVNLYDDGLDGIPGNGDDVLIATTTTDAAGNYLFTGLPVDGDGETYRVEIAASNFIAGGPLAGLSQTYDADGTGTANQSTVTISTASPAAQVDLDQDFGYRDAVLNSIGDFVWGDLDSDGDGPNGNGGTGADNAEPGLAGVTVRLFNDGPDGIPGNADDVLVATTATDGTGYYLFDSLPDDVYTVVVDTTTLPSGWNTTPTGDPDGGADSKSTVTVAGGVHNRVQDFGYPPAATPLYSIGDTVWFDIDNSATSVQDAGEPGLAGVTVELYDSTGTTLLGPYAR
jgi:hypothetical protein